MWHMYGENFTTTAFFDHVGVLIQWTTLYERCVLFSLQLEVACNAHNFTEASKVICGQWACQILFLFKSASWSSRGFLGAGFCLWGPQVCNHLSPNRWTGLHFARQTNKTLWSTCALLSPAYGIKISWWHSQHIKISEDESGIVVHTLAVTWPSLYVWFYVKIICLYLQVCFDCLFSCWQADGGTWGGSFPKFNHIFD